VAYVRLRQICLVAQALEPRVAELTDILGLAICYRDGNVGKYGLANALMPIGASFLEVVAPVTDGTAAGRYLQRRGGDGGYMVILDCDDIERRRRRMAEIHVRIANPLSYETYTGLQLHPRDTGGCMLEFNHTTGGASLDGPYHPAGPNWRAAVRGEVTAALLAAEVQSRDPDALATRWSEIVERPVSHGAGGEPQIVLDLGAIRFVRDADGRGEGLGGLDLRVTNRAQIIEAARKHGCRADADTVTLCGTRFRLTV
jgi:hypothetical protein